MTISPAQFVAWLPDDMQLQWLAVLDAETRARLRWDWRFWARREQIAPMSDQRVWLYCAGRGIGKTRSGSGWVRQMAMAGVGPLGIVGETAADARDVIVEGPAGILAAHPNHERPTYEPSKRRLTWSKRVTDTLYSGTDPEQLRGPGLTAAQADELAKYMYADDVWDQLQFTLREGAKPRTYVATTPRSIPLVKDLLNLKDTMVSSGSTAAHSMNLAPIFIAEVYA